MVKSIPHHPPHGTPPTAPRPSVVMKKSSPDLLTMLSTYVPLMRKNTDHAAAFWKVLKHKLRHVLCANGITPPTPFKIIVPPGTLVLAPPPIRRATATPAPAPGAFGFAQRPTIGVLIDPREAAGTAERAEIQFSKYYKITAAPGTGC